MLTLDDFDRQLPKDLLKKAQPYYQDGSVLYVDQGDDGTWHAEVAGSDTYSVEITLDKRTITDSFCDCPVESSLCKHVVAVFFALRDELKKQAAQPKSGRTPKKLTVADLLKQVTADELRTFLTDYAAADKTFAAKLQLHFASKDERIDVEKHYADLLKRIIRSHQGKHGYIEYRETFKLARDMDEMFSAVVKLVGQKNFKDALTVGLLLLREMMTLSMECDDSAGNIGGLVSESVSLLGEIGLDADAPPALRRNLFDTLATEVKDKRYFDNGDIGLDMLDLLKQLAIRLGEPDRFLTVIEQLLIIHPAVGRSYYADHLRTTRVDFLREIGRTDEADRQTQASLDVVSVRMQVVNEAMAQKDYDRAKTLIRDGILIAQAKNTPGTVNDWNKQLLAIAEAERDTAEIRRLTRYFAFDSRFSTDYFRKWKATFGAGEWADEYPRLIDTIRRDEAEKAASQKPGWGRDPADGLLYRLKPIFIEEKQWADLLTLVQQVPRLEVLKEVLPYLAGPYPADLLTLFMPPIKKLGHQASTRPDYANVAALLKLVRQQIAGSRPATDALIAELKETFPKRPAYQEELRAIK
ncbi:MAG: SWIM zinc finger family protein [Spirosoma sp.]|nr:SWIM zinc finger family protein [Spirosoma sp.]